MLKELRTAMGHHHRTRKRYTTAVLSPRVRSGPKRKTPFDIDEMMNRLRGAVKEYTPAAMFQLADEGYDSVFEILVACIISIRTLEEVTLPTARKLFGIARTPQTV